MPMSSLPVARSTVTDPAPAPRLDSGGSARLARNRRRASLLGQALTWLCGGALAFNLLLVIGILTLLLVNGMGYFWQKDLVLLTQKDGKKILGEVWEVEKTKATADESAHDRFRLKIGNRDV